MLVNNVLLLPSSRKTVRSIHPHSNLTRMILGNVSVADAVEISYVSTNSVINFIYWL